MERENIISMNNKDFNLADVSKWVEEIAESVCSVSSPCAPFTNKNSEQKFFTPESLKEYLVRTKHQRKRVATARGLLPTKTIVQKC